MARGCRGGGRPCHHLTFRIASVCRLPCTRRCHSFGHAISNLIISIYIRWQCNARHAPHLPLPYIRPVPILSDSWPLPTQHGRLPACSASTYLHTYSSTMPVSHSAIFPSYHRRVPQFLLFIYCTAHLLLTLCTHFMPWFNLSIHWSYTTLRCLQPPTHGMFYQVGLFTPFPTVELLVDTPPRRPFLQFALLL